MTNRSQYLDRFRNKLRSLRVKTHKDEFIYIDYPTGEVTNRRFVNINGWFASRRKYTQLRVIYPDGKVLPLKLNIPRQDVVNHFRAQDRRVQLKCGFNHLVDKFKDGIYTIQAMDIDAGWHDVKHILITYDRSFVPTTEKSDDDALKGGFTKHLAKISNKKAYYYEDAKEVNYIRHKSDPKIIAFYLPQYYSFEENDKWWGKGFTEWRNVGSGTPRFIGHEQPRVPLDLGYYNLQHKDVHASQIELAQNAGVYGFCYYYYWFSGKRLLDKPLDIILKNKDLNAPFMICWANENWTRRWDGLNQHVLIKQENHEDDPINFIKDVESILLDKRYIRIDGKPALMVYRAEDLGDPLHYTTVWREYFRKHHKTELHLIAVRSFAFDDPQKIGFDKALFFAPMYMGNKLVEYSGKKLLDDNYEGYVVDFRRTVLKLIEDQEYTEDYLSVMPSWDNDARRRGKGSTVFHGSNPDLYAKWLNKTVGISVQNGSNVSFVNAWNEWAEGAYLEPDTLYGHAYLNKTREIVLKYSKNNKSIQTSRTRTPTAKIAIILHLFHTDMWPLFLEYIKRLDASSYDLHVSIPIGFTDMKKEIESSMENVFVYELPNVGRDILPFLHITQHIENYGYEFILKIHSKKSLHREDGNEWLMDMLDKLIPQNKNTISQIYQTLKKKRTALIGPSNHYISLKNYMGSNEEELRSILKIKTGVDIKNYERFGYFAGTMFWIRLDSIRPLIEDHYNVDDFQPEEGQLDATFAHAFERALSVLPQLTNKSLYEVSSDSGMVTEVTKKNILKHYRHASDRKG